MKSSTILFPMIFCVALAVSNLQPVLSFAPTGTIPSKALKIPSSKPYPPLSASSVISSTGSKNKVSSSFKNLNYALLKKRLALQKRLLGKRNRAGRRIVLPTFSLVESSTTNLSSIAFTAEASATAVQDNDVTTMTTTSTSQTFFRETAVRSAVKALMWRIIAGAVTFLTTMKFSNGSVSAALSLVGSDFSSKVITMFIGERIMDKSSTGRDTGSDSTSRSLIKALVWRVFAICNTLTVAVFISKDWSVASKIAGSDAIVKTMMMFVYERVWSQIQWGKECPDDFSTASSSAVET